MIIGFSANAARVDLSGPRPPRVWRENGAVMISCQGCTRALRLVDLPAGQVVCPDCHETHSYNLTRPAGEACLAPTNGDRLRRHLANREIALMVVEILAATEHLRIGEIRNLLLSLVDEIAEHRGQHEKLG